ncbi:MAG TPA: hypothetical protein VFA55_08180 [Candidatus Kapabacteria bacterium]|nr:hypothetical protein [Candidatus Kapabacteria bacterium]
MAKCKEILPSGSVCGNTLYECPDCGNIGCISNNGICTGSLFDEDGRCVLCGSSRTPKLYVDFNEIGTDYA